MNPGKMNVRMLVLRPAVRVDASGGAVTDWQEAGVIWAARETFTQRLQNLAQLQATVGEQTFKTRYVTYLTAGCRVMIGEEQYRVVSVVEEQTPLPRTYISFTVKEGEAQ